jgi:hypothetical protein
VKPHEGVTRPAAKVLPASAIVPKEDSISPAPNQFTHVLTRAQPYFFVGSHEGMSPNVELSAGTNVVLLVHDGGNRCRAADEQGLYVEIECDSLRRLKTPKVRS